MTDQGNEIARYEKSTISMTHMSHDPSAVRFTSGGTERVISGGMILIDNIETSVTTYISHKLIRCQETAVPMMSWISYVRT